MNEYIGILTDDEDMLELVEVVGRRRTRKVYRPREDHFQKWTDLEFAKRFRLSKNGVRFVLRNIEEQISHSTQRNKAVSADIMLFVTLRFFATGSFLQVVGDFSGIDKATACRIVHKVSRTIASLRGTFILMPSTEEEMAMNSAQFYNIARFPKCIGAVDCTHIKIVSPGGAEPEVYRNRKSFFSLNCQVVCDANCKIQNIVCRWPGSSHDSTIFNNSRLRARFENDQFNNYLLLGDSGYGIKQYLITPLANPVTEAEHLFNESQIRTRNPIERTFGIWKRRFPVLAIGIRQQLHKVEAIVVATAVLHNIAMLLHEEVPPINEEVEEQIIYVNNVQVANVRDVVGGLNNAIRYQLINEYFNALNN